MSLRWLVLLAVMAALIGPGSPARAGTVYSNVVKNEANLLLYWNFDETSGGNVVEQKTGDVQNNLVPDTGVSLVAHEAIGSALQLGSAGVLPGAKCFYAGNLTPTTNPTQYAIELWMQPSSVAGSQSAFVVSCKGDFPAVAFDFAPPSFPPGDNSVTLYKAAWPLSNNPVIGDTHWHYLLFLVNGPNVSAYLDDTLWNLTGTFNQPLTVTDSLAVGSHINGSRPWGYVGRVDELAFYDFTGMTSQQILTRGSQLAGHYRLAMAPEPSAWILAVSAAIPSAQWLRNRTRRRRT